MPTTTLTGTLLGPDGTGFNGYLIFTLSQNASYPGTPAEIVPNVPIKILVTNGSLVSPPTLYGNDVLLPVGTFYYVQAIDLNGNILFNDEWSITGSTFNIGTVVSTLQPSFAFQTGNLVSLSPGLTVTGGTNAVLGGNVTLTLNTSSIFPYVPENVANKGAASGYAPLNASSQVPLANLSLGSATQPGILQVGSNLSLGGGVIGVPVATTFSPGVVQIGNGLSISGGVLSSASSMYDVAGFSGVLANTTNGYIGQSTTILSTAWKDGFTIRLNTCGQYSTKSSAPGTLILTVNLDTIQLTTFGTITLPANVTGGHWSLEATLIQTNNVITGISVIVVTAGGMLVMDSGATPAILPAIFSSTPIALNVNRVLQVQAQYSVADPNNSIQILGWAVQVWYPQNVRV